MDLQAKLEAAEKKFEEFKQEREAFLAKAEECLQEMTKLQGEYRLLQELLQETDANTQPTVIEAVPEKPSKKEK